MLYLVGTPIGNMRDISVRQADTIAQADYILCEDTRSTGILLKKITELFKISINPLQRCISFHKHSEFEKIPYVLDLLKKNLSVVLISQAGMPLISDPGNFLVRTLIKKNIPFTVIPGPTAFVSGLLYSGFDWKHFSFYGFLPKKKGEILRLLTEIKKTSISDKHHAHIFYETPKRIKTTLSLIAHVDPSATVSISREITKLFEETVRGYPKELAQREYKGEMVLTVLFSAP